VWYAIWAVLVVAALAVPALLALGLWRRMKALGRDLSAAGDRAGRSFAGFEDVEAPHARAVPTLLAPETAARSLALIRADHAIRDRRRALTLARVADRWARYGLIGRTPDRMASVHEP